MSAFVTSDLHLGHSKSITFLKPDKSLLRPFMNLGEMHNVLITRWNKIISPQDRVYILGDVAIARNSLCLLNEFNGNKVLIKGNHDTFKLKDYLPYFDDIRGAFVRGSGTSALDPSSPRAVGSFQAEAYLNHSHGVTDPTHSHTYSTNSSTSQATGGSGSEYFRNASTYSTGAASTGISVNTSTTGGTETRPDNYALLYIIKT